MESVILDMVSRFEKGGLTRRELVQGLAMLVGVGAGTGAASAQEPVDFKGSIIDHVSIQVADLQKSTEFYTKLFGFTVLSEDKPNGIIRMGFTKPLVSINPVKPTGIVDHRNDPVQPGRRERTSEGTRPNEHKQSVPGILRQGSGRSKHPVRSGR